MTKNIFKGTMSLFLLLGTVLGFTACSSDDIEKQYDRIGLNIQATAPTDEDKVADYSSFEVKIKSERTGATTTAKLNKAGTAVVTVDKGSYSIEITGTVNGKEYFGTIGTAQYAASKVVTVAVKHVVPEYAGAMKGIVFKELFYNGGTYTGRMQHPDQYVVLQNNSDHDINIKGLVVAQVSRMNTLPSADLTALLPDFVVTANMYQVPTDYVMKPGGICVIASSALNHKEGRAHQPDDTGVPVDLSGADFELADADASMSGAVTDNNEVPNLTKISNSLPNGVTGWMHPYGIRPMIIFDGSQIDWNTYKPANAVTYKDKINTKAEVKEYQGYKIATKLIIDGVETTSTTTPYWGGFQSKSLPATVDKGKAEATEGSCHQNRYMYRVAAANGKLQDTNDSSVDMKLVHRTDFVGYPKGWRNK